MNSLRAPTSNAQWYQIRAQDRAQREREAAAAKGEPEAPVEPAEAPTAPEAAQPTSPAAPTVLTLEQRRELRRTRERLSKSTKSQVRAAALDKVNAKKHADRVVDKLTRAGKL